MRRFIQISALILVFGVIFSPLLLKPLGTAFGEGTSFFGHPYAMIRYILFNDHRIPLWDPYSGAGNPLAADPLAGQFYPPLVLNFLAPTPLDGLRWMVFVHLLVAAIGSYVAALWIGCTALTAALAPMGFLLNRNVCGNLLINGLPGELFTLPWMIWGFAFLWRSLQRSDFRWLMASAACLALQILGGTTYEIYFTFLLSLVTVFLWVITCENPWKQKLQRGVLSIGGLAVLAAGLGAIKLLPVLLYQPLSTRSGYSLAEAERGLANIPTLPQILSNFQNLFLSSTNSPLFTNAYLFLGAVALGGWLLLRPLRRPAQLLTIVLIISIWGSLGERAPIDLYAILHRYLPGFKMNQFTSRLLSLAYLSLPLLVALGATFIQTIFNRWFSKKRVAAVLACFVLWGYWEGGYAAWKNLQIHDYGQVKRVLLNTRGALLEPPRIVPAPDGGFLLKTQLMNVGDEPWDSTLEFEYEIGDASYPLYPNQTMVAPGNSAVFERIVEIPKAPSAYTINLRIHSQDSKILGSLKLFDIERGQDGHCVVRRTHKGFQSSAELSDCLTSPLPENFNAWLSTLARVQGRHNWRVYSVYPKEVYPYPALLNGFDIMNYSNHGIKPKYHYHTEHNLKISNVQRTWRLFEILNVRYLLFGTADTYLHPDKSRPIHITPEAGLYEVTSALPRAWVPSATILLIGEDKDRDLNSLEAKLLLYHPVWDSRKWAVFRSEEKILDKHTLEQLGLFTAVVLTKPVVHSASKANALLEAYRQKGGVVVELNYDEHPYENPVTAELSMLGGINPETTFIDNPVPAKSLTSASEQTLGSLLRQKVGAPEPPATITIERLTPGAWRLRLSTERQITPVVLSETYYPGWYAEVDGQPAKVWMADGIIRGLLVPGKGEHLITLSYHPTGLFWGALITSLALAGCISALLWVAPRHKLF